MGKNLRRGILENPERILTVGPKEVAMNRLVNIADAERFLNSSSSVLNLAESRAFLNHAFSNSRRPYRYDTP